MSTGNTDVEPEPVTILVLGAEGGGVTLVGRNIGNGEWEFLASLVDQTPTYLAGIDAGEEIRDWTDWVSGWGSALALLDQRFRYWPRLSPVVVHPDFRDLVLDAVRIRSGAEEAETWADRIDRKARGTQGRTQ